MKKYPNSESDTAIIETRELEEPEYLCAECSYMEVCMYKDDYRRVQDAVDTVKVYSEGEGDSVGIRSLNDFPWLKTPVGIRCKYFTRTVRYR